MAKKTKTNQAQVSRRIKKPPRLRAAWWDYRRENGDVGSRNYLLVLSGLFSANPVCERVARTFRHAVSITHPLGRCQIAPDLERTLKTLVGQGLNANAGAVLVIDHYHENERSGEEITHKIARSGKRVELVNIRKGSGIAEATAKATRIGMEMVRELTNEQRQEAPVSKLLVGLNCGRSDTISSLSHNKAVGWVTDQVVRLGGRAILAETTEMMRAEGVLASKCVRPSLEKRIWKIVRETEKKCSCIRRGPARKPADNRQYSGWTRYHRGKILERHSESRNDTHRGRHSLGRAGQPDKRTPRHGHSGPWGRVPHRNLRRRGAGTYFLNERRSYNQSSPDVHHSRYGQPVFGTPQPGHDRR